MEPVPPPAPGGPAVPRLSTTVLFAIAGIGAIVLASIFGYILFIATLRLDERLWWIGFGSDQFAKLLYLILLSVLVIIALGAIFVMTRDAERDAVRRAQRRHIP